MSNFQPIPRYGDHMTVQEFAEQCAAGSLTSDDGSGYYATATEMSDVPVVCDVTALTSQFRPEWATHVVWFNQ